MKYIFVTMKEFIAKGGILSKGRDIYDDNERYIGSYVKKQGFLHIIETGNSSHPAATSVHFVKIEVRPIWK